MAKLRKFLWKNNLSILIVLTIFPILSISRPIRLQPVVNFKIRIFNKPIRYPSDCANVCGKNGGKQNLFADDIFKYSGCFVSPNEIEPNDNFDQANGPVCIDTQIWGNLNTDSDFYKIDMGVGNSISATLEPTNNDGVQLLLYDQDGGDPVVYDPTSPFEVQYTADSPGWHYLRVGTGSITNQSSYLLSIDLTR